MGNTVKMRKICAWCQKETAVKKSQSGSDDAPISHGICPDCARKVLSYRAEPLRSFLDRFSDPVFFINAEGQIITANKAAFSVLEKQSKEVEGQLGGDVFDCRYADLPGGCGNTIHCKTCTIRTNVTDTLQSGRSHIRVPAYPDLHHMTGEKKIRFLISTEKVGDAVLLRIDEICEEN